ncbi:MAG: hypothetical protein WBA99_04925 [Nodosilinea sp.]
MGNGWFIRSDGTDCFGLPSKGRGVYGSNVNQGQIQLYRFGGGITADLALDSVIFVFRR